LHLYLNSSYLDTEILKLLIPNTDLNIQNNNGLTCLKMLFELDILDDYVSLLQNKELNFFIEDNNGEDLSASLKDKKILSLATDSYYNILKEKKDNLILDWEMWCSKDMIDKLKTLKINHKEPIHICKEKIQQVILKEKRSLPKFTNNNLIMDNGIFINTCYYTGVPLDIVSGILFLYTLAPDQ
jgi:hypothetical protein